MTRVLNILIIFFGLSFSLFSQKSAIYNNKGFPSSLGITEYVNNNSQSIIEEYEQLIDTLYDIYIYVEDLSSEKEDILGQFYTPDNIIITSEEKFTGFELKDLIKSKKVTSYYTGQTVKGTIFHELTHAYFNQSLILMQIEKKYVSPEYNIFKLYSNYNRQFSVKFIEEGICEYTVNYLNERAAIESIRVPTSIDYLLDKEHIVNNIYRYSVIFLKDFLDEYGIKRGIEILLGNKPPSLEEILKPKLFFGRLNIN